MRSSLAFVFALACMGALSACAPGGSGAPGASASAAAQQERQTPFAQLLGLIEPPPLSPSADFVARGFGREATMTTRSAGSSSWTQTPFVSSEGISALIKTDHRGRPISHTLRGSGAAETWNESNGRFSTYGGRILLRGSRREPAGISLAVRQGPDQAAGVWFAGNLGETRNRLGAYSLGEESPAPAPSAGRAAYRGVAAGFVFGETPEEAKPAVYEAVVEADFAAGSARLRLEGVEAAMRVYDLGGELRAEAGGARFSGPVAMANGLSGTAELRFYGAWGERIGGVLTLQNAGRETAAVFLIGRLEDPDL